jgi:hypothetical protein
MKSSLGPICTGVTRCGWAFNDVRTRTIYRALTRLKGPRLAPNKKIKFLISTLFAIGLLSIVLDA